MNTVDPLYLERLRRDALTTGDVHRARLYAEKLKRVLAPKTDQAPVTEAEAKRSVVGLARLTTPHYNPTPVHRLLGRIVDAFITDVLLGKHPRLWIETPPRIGKTTIVSHHLPLAAMGRSAFKPQMFPNGMGIALTSYSASLATENSRIARTLASDHRVLSVYPHLSPPRISRTRGYQKQNFNKIDDWSTQSGRVLAVGADGPFTGKGANIIVFDDLIKSWADAQSRRLRETVSLWLQSVAKTRLDSMASGMIAIGTRWHVEEPIAAFVAKDSRPWHHVKLKAIADCDENWLGVLVRRAGEALDPDRWPLSSLYDIRDSIAPQIWSALYQQSPTIEDGGFFDADNLKETPYLTWASVPENWSVWISTDAAKASQEKNDRHVVGEFAVSPEGQVHCIKVWHGRVPYEQYEAKVIESIERLKERMVRTRGKVIVEDAANGSTLLLNLRSRYGGLLRPFLAQSDTPGKDKSKEARAIYPQVLSQRGLLYLPKQIHLERSDGESIRTQREELLTFPNGVHDDHVDTISQLCVILATASKHYSVLDMLAYAGLGSNV